MKSASCVSVVACLTILSSVASAQAWPGGRGSGGAHSYDLPVSLVLEPHRQSAWRIQTQVGGELPVTVTAVGGVTDGGSASGASEVAVQVTDASGNPVPDILVGFQLDEGSATLAPAVASTNQKGIAMTAVATRSSERIVVRATASALVGEPVTFTITPGAVAGGEASKSGVAPAPMRAGDH